MDAWNIVREFVTLFVVIDPIGSVPVFFFATSQVPPHLHRRFALRAVLIAGCVLVAFMVGGQFLIEGLGLRIGSFKIAGGIVLFLFAMTMIFGESKPDLEIEEAERDHLSGAIFPLAMPSIASPGAMLAVVILTDNHEKTLVDQTVTLGLLVVVLLVTLVILFLASGIRKLIGNGGASIISRVMGMILATVAVDSVVNGLDELGVLHTVAGGMQ